MLVTATECYYLLRLIAGEWRVSVPHLCVVCEGPARISTLFGLFWRREISLSSLRVFCSTFFSTTPSAFTRSRSASMASSVDSWPLLFHMCADGKSHYSPDGDLTSRHDGPALVCTFIEEMSSDSAVEAAHNRLVRDVRVSSICGLGGHSHPMIFMSTKWPLIGASCFCVGRFTDANSLLWPVV